MIARIVGRNSEVYYAAQPSIGSIRLTPIAPYGRHRREVPKC
jgi:hypothetical protein